jgi:hypothetical protein
MVGFSNLTVFLAGKTKYTGVNNGYNISVHSRNRCLVRFIGDYDLPAIRFTRDAAAGH